MLTWPSECFCIIIPILWVSTGTTYNLVSVLREAVAIQIERNCIFVSSKVKEREKARIMNLTVCFQEPCQEAGCLYIHFLFSTHDISMHFPLHIKQSQFQCLLRDCFLSVCVMLHLLSKDILSYAHLHAPLCYIYIRLTHLIENIVKNLGRLPHL